MLFSPGELPVTLNLSRFDHDPGFHRLSVVANSTTGKLADYEYSFTIPGTCYINCNVGQNATTDLICFSD